jgi:diketogulonate reductase-like aldo/keto reductase
MLMRRIPTSGEMIPAVGLGTSGAFEAGPGEAERAPLREVLRIFHAAGGRVIDSSPMYGTAESVIGELLQQLGLSRSVFRATKVWTSGREAGIRQMEQSERRMGGVRIDLMQVHNLVDVETHLPTLREWKAAGRIRYLGITHSQSGAFDRLERLIRTERLDFVQLNYSLAEPEAERRLLPLAADVGTAVLVNRPFADGGLFRRVRGQVLPEWAREFDCASWAQFFLKYVLSHAAATCTIPATSKPRHAEDNMRGGYGLLPNEAQRARMRRLVESL